MNQPYKFFFPVPVRAEEVGLVRQVRPSLPASICSFPTLRLNLVLTRGIPPALRGGVHLFIPLTAIGSVPSLSVHAIAHRWYLLPRVCRRRASIGCFLLRYRHGPIFVRLSFPTPTIGTVWMYGCMGITYSKSKDQPGKVANPARGQLNRENEYFPVPVWT